MVHTHFQCIQANGIATPGCAIWHEEQQVGIAPICPTCEGTLAMPIDPGILRDDVEVVPGRTAEIYARTQQTAQAPATITPVGDALPEQWDPENPPPPAERTDLPEPANTSKRKGKVVPVPEAEASSALNDEPYVEDDYVVSGEPPEIPETAPNIDIDADEASPTTKDTT